MRDSWSVVPLHEVSTRVTEKNKNLIDRVFTVSAGHGLIDQEKYFNKRVASKNLLGYSVVRPGMLVYNKSYSAIAPYGVITRNNHQNPGVVSPLYTVFLPNDDKVVGQFLEMACNSSMFFDSLRQFIKEGGRAHGGITISLGHFFDCKIPLPPMDEQKRIVDLVSSVDAYIDSLQQQVDSARSARNAVLHELLSAGGDDWTQTTLGDIAAINPEAANGLSLDDEIVYVDLASVSAETGISTDLFRGAFGDAPGRARRVIRSQDVLVSTVRPYLKGFAQVPSFLDGEIASTGFAVLRANPQKTLPGFIWAIVGLTGFVGHLMDRATGSSYPAVRPNDVASFAIELPPLEEQKRIVDLVSSMDEVIAASEQSVADAKNFRSGLLSDLLSGEHEIPKSYDELMGDK